MPQTANSSNDHGGTMKKRWLVLVGAAVTLGAAVGSIPGIAQQKTTGNGAPSGAHYDLNIIGVTKAKAPSMNGSNRHTIFVPLVSDQGALDTETRGDRKSTRLNSSH